MRQVGLRSPDKLLLSKLDQEPDPSPTWLAATAAYDARNTVSECHARSSGEGAAVASAGRTSGPILECVVGITIRELGLQARADENASIGPRRHVAQVEQPVNGATVGAV